jgi:hypothetical protein
VALARERIGDFEGDLILGRHGLSAIGTLVDRATRYVRLVHVPEQRRGEDFAAALEQVGGDNQRVPFDLVRDAFAMTQIPSSRNRHKASIVTAWASASCFLGVLPTMILLSSYPDRPLACSGRLLCRRARLRASCAVVSD